MSRASWIIVVAIGLLVTSLWAWVNRPNQVPTWPSTIKGMAFSPYQAGQSPEEDKHPDEAQIRADLALLADKVHAVRTYSVAGVLGEIPRLAADYGINVAVGLWLSDDKAANEAELARFEELFKQYHRQIVRVVVGNEVLLRRDLTEQELIGYLKRVKAIVGPRKISTAETWDQWLKHPRLAEYTDYVAVHILPYWEGLPAEAAVDYVFTRYADVQREFPQQEVVIGEVGWPSNGRQRGASIPSLQNQAAFLRHFTHRAEREGFNYYVLEAFDQVWKEREGAVGSHWGVFSADREVKFAFQEPIRAIPQWPQLVTISVGLSVLILAFLLKDSSGLVHRGRGFLVAVSYAVTTFVVWLVYDYSQRYMAWQEVVIGTALLLAVLGIAVVIIAEAHEWAEAIWTKTLRRQPAKRHVDEDELPMVSIHLPAYNEPPDMMIKTLEALAQLDYPRYEVLVIDNNTADEATWRPVEQWCAQRDEQFQFFHKSPLAGFKAGALNYVLTKTHSDAEIIACIDSDYQVEAGWLRDLVPHFSRDRVAIVQAPQDYRDGHENAFKAMCYSEYAGFFHIGMVTRNERNAIIQHGTMTMVRRTVLDEVGGWPEWCITEDAELGLRIFEAGYEAIYIPCSYGQGLMPDTFLDFKKQRFRWAYGAVLILREHFRYLTGLSRSKLSRGQRYHFLAGWLPWLADGMSLLFNCLALAWSLMMILKPHDFTPPEIGFSLLPIGFLVFKSLKMFALYRRRMGATLRQSMAAGLAGLALSHTISRAMLAGLTTDKIGFFRTPKNADKQGLGRAIGDAREELLLAVAMVLSAWAIGLRDDAQLLDTQLWQWVLIIQSIPYWASVVVSAVSAMPGLSARWVGQLPRIGGKAGS